MASKNLFRGTPGKQIPETNTVNLAGGKAYAFSPKHALAQFAVTGCFRDTFYATDKDQLDTVKKLVQDVDSSFIAKTAVYARTKGFMKDMPAFLACVLASRKDKESHELLGKIFPKVIDNGRMLRNFVQIIRSGQTGRKSLGTMPRRLVRNFLNSHDGNWLFRNSVGNDPSFGDIVKMAHPRGDAEHEALYGYFIGAKMTPEKWNALPTLVNEFETWKSNKDAPPPEIPFEFLTAQQLTGEQWAKIFKKAGWHFTRMNLNTALRHGVFEKEPELVGVVAARLRDPEAIRKARVFPYQLLAAYKHVSAEVPREITGALHDAMEISVENVPEIKGKVFVFPDVSGSMSDPVTGHRDGATSKMTCVDIAALFSSCILRRNPNARVVPVDTQVHIKSIIDPRDTVMTNSTKLAKFGGGGTSLSEALKWMNGTKDVPDAVIFVSDNESWVDSNRLYGGGTEMMVQFRETQKRNSNVKMVCIDINPSSTTQASDSKGSILNVGGWSDRVFDVISAFLNGSKESWVDVIEKTEI